MKIKIYNTILTEKPQKIWALSSNSTDKYEYLTGDEIQPSNQIQVVDKAKFAYFLLQNHLKNRQRFRQIV